MLTATADAAASANWNGVPEVRRLQHGTLRKQVLLVQAPVEPIALPGQAGGGDGGVGARGG